MDDELYEIEKDNIKNRKRADFVTLIGATIFIALISFWISFDRTVVWPWFLITANLILTFILIRRFENKIIGRKESVSHNMDRIIDDEDLDLDDDLELKEILINYSDDELV